MCRGTYLYPCVVIERWQERVQGVHGGVEDMHLMQISSCLGGASKEQVKSVSVMLLCLPQHMKVQK